MGLFDKAKKILNDLNKKFEDYSRSENIVKPFDDVLKFFRNYCPTSTGTNAFRWNNLTTKKDINQGTFHTIQKENTDHGNYFTVTIFFLGKVATKVQVDMFASDAHDTVEWLFKELNDAVKDCEKPVQQQATVPVEDYSTYSLSELLDVFDAKVKTLGAMPDMANLMAVKNVRLAIGTKIDALPLAERGKFTKATGNIDMYLGTINTQLSNPMTANMIGQFIGTYISQIQGSISEIATAL